MTYDALLLNRAPPYIYRAMHVYVLMIYTQYIAALGDQFKFIWEEEGLELRQEFVIFRYCWSGFWFSVLWYSVGVLGMAGLWYLSVLVRIHSYCRRNFESWIARCADC